MGLCLLFLRSELENSGTLELATRKFWNFGAGNGNFLKLSCGIAPRQSLPGQLMHRCS